MTSSINSRLEAATEIAEEASDIMRRFANEPEGSTIPTASGLLPSLAEWLKRMQDRTIDLPAALLPLTGEEFLDVIQGDESRRVRVADLVPDAQEVDSSEVSYDSITVSDALDYIRPLASYTALRNYSGQAFSVRVTQSGIAGFFNRKDSDTTSADNGGTIIIDALGRRWEREFDGAFQGDWFQLTKDGSDPSGNTTKLLAAIASLRQNPVNGLVQYVGGPTVTAYSTSVIEFGAHLYALTPDLLDFNGDHAVTLKGKGSRRHNQAIMAATCLLFKGASSGFGFRFTGNGARNAAFESMDICYENASFTGDLVDSVAAPGLNMRDVRIGCYGGTGATRVQTARSCVRVSFDEFHCFRDVVFDGAALGWWSDDARVLGSATFGGAETTFDNCVFYDITDCSMKHSGARARIGLNIRGSSFNPINVDCDRALSLNNIDCLVLDGASFSPSTTKKATTEWATIVNCTGSIKGNVFGALAKAGSLSGFLEVSGNRCSGTDGFTLGFGIIKGGANEFRSGTNGYLVSPTLALTLDIGPDTFLSAVTNSYNIPAESNLLSGCVNYASEQDQSTGKFTNASTRITIENVDKRIITVSSLPGSASVRDSGRTYNVTAAGIFPLPMPVPGTSFRVMKSTATALTIAAADGSSFLAGVAGNKTQAVATATEMGAELEFVAFSSTVWLVRVTAGTWSFS